MLRYINQPGWEDESWAGAAAGGSGSVKSSAAVFRLDTLHHWNARPGGSSSESGQPVKQAGLHRTPTTRSDPLQFSLMNKENESALTNLAHMRSRLVADTPGPALPPEPAPPTSNYSSLSTNRSAIMKLQCE